MKMNKIDALKWVGLSVLMFSLSVDTALAAASTTTPTGSTFECPPSNQGQQVTSYATQASALIDKMVPAPTASAINSGAQGCLDALKNIQNIGFQSGLTFFNPSTLIDMACGYLKNKESSFISGLIPSGGLNFDPNSLVSGAVAGAISSGSGSSGSGGSGISGGGAYTGTLPSGVVTATPVRGKTYNLSTETYTFPITVRSGYNSYGAAYTPTNPTQKITWISTTPGGAPVSDEFIAQGYTEANVLISGGQAGHLTRKQLPIGGQYYLNVRNATLADPNTTTCPERNCSFVLDIPN